MNEQGVAQSARASAVRQEARQVLFLSHAGVDAEAALKLADLIEATPEARERGLKVWVDKRDLEAGSGWQHQLERAIEERSTAFAVYVGATGIINWVDSEVGVALSRARSDQNYRFIPIISASAEGSSALPPFARQYQAVVDVENRPDELAKLIRAALGATARQPVQLVEQPFPGLRAFDEQQANLFFGREAETEELVEKLRREPLLMVVGDSGSGKSSLVRAGLVPRFRGGALADLTRDQPDDTIWHVVIARPRGRPFEALADPVFQSGDAAGIDAAKLGTCKDWIRTGQPAKVRDGLIHGAPPRARILLVIDQFEELLTQAEEASRQPYIDALLGLVADPADPRVRVVMTMRYDYYNLCSQFPSFFDRLEGRDGQSRYPLERMKEPGLRACVQEPLKLAGVDDTETLANEVVKDIGERPGNLALLQMALKEAWQKRKQFKDDLLEAYISVGRVTGALANAANEIFENQLSDQERERAKVAFIRLVRLGDTGGTTRRVATRDEFSDDIWAVVQKLATEECRRLLSIRGASGKETVELAHEALATQWPRYQIWLQEAAGDKRRLDSLIDRVRRWHTTGKAEEDLASGTEREEFRALAQWRPAWLAGDERQFVEASIARKQREETRAKIGVITLVVMTIVAMAMAAFAVAQTWEARSAEAKALHGDSLYRAEQARKLLDAGFPVTAMQLALAGLPENPAGPQSGPWAGETASGLLQAVGVPPSSNRPWVSETAGALTEAMGAQRERLVLRGHEGAVYAAAFSPDGARIVSWSADDTVRVWDATTGKKLLVLRGHEGGVTAAAFSPDGARIVSLYADGTLRAWDAASGAELLVLRGLEAPVGSAGFYPNGARIVSGCADNTVRVWDVVNGKALLVLRGHEARVNAAAFSPDGARIVSAGADKTIRVWDASSGKQLLVLRGHNGDVFASSFSPEGKRIVSASLDMTVRVWDAQSGAELLVLRGHENGVNAVEYSSDGKRIVSGSADRTVRAWDAASGDELMVLRGHEGHVLTTTFSPDGARLLSASGDRTIRLWESGGAIVRDHKAPVGAAAFSPDGARIVTGLWDNTVRVWDAASGNELLVVRSHEEAVYAAAFSPDGARFVSGSADDTVRVWDAASGKELLVLRGHAGDVWAAEFSPDGARIVSGSADGTVRVWEAASGKELLVLRGHAGDVWAAAFSPDGARIVSGSADGTIRAWDAAAGTELLVQRSSGSSVYAVAFSPDGAYIVSGSADGTTRLWDAETGKDFLALRGHGGSVFAAEFSPDGARIVSGSADNTVRLWDAASSAELLVLRGHEQHVYAAAFSPDGARIVSGSGDKTVRVIWVPRSKQELIETARARLPRELTDEERRRFHLAVE